MMVYNMEIDNQIHTGFIIRSHTQQLVQSTCNIFKVLAARVNKQEYLLLLAGHV